MVRSVIYIIIEVIIHTEISSYFISWRQDLNTETEAVMMTRSIEMSRTVIRQKVPFTRRNTVHIVVIYSEIIRTVIEAV